jgi:hypothetical protein
MLPALLSLAQAFTPGIDDAELKVSLLQEALLIRANH